MYQCGQALMKNNNSTKKSNGFIFWTSFQNVMINSLIPMDTIATHMPLRNTAHQMAATETGGKNTGAYLQTSPIATAKLQLYANNADV